MKKHRMIKPGGYHSGPGLRRTLTVWGPSQPEDLCALWKEDGECPNTVFVQNVEEHSEDAPSSLTGYGDYSSPMP